MSKSKRHSRRVWLIFMVVFAVVGCRGDEPDDVVDAGERVVFDTGSEDTGSEDTGSEDTGSEDTGGIEEDVASSDVGDPLGDVDVDGELFPDVGADVEPVDPCADPVVAGPFTAMDISTGLFIGRPAQEAGASSRPVAVDSFDAYRQHFGLAAGAALEEDDRLGWAVSLFFRNGGTRAWIYPTASEVPSQTELAGIDAPPGTLVVPGLSTLAEESERRAAYARIREFLARDDHRHIFFIGELPRAWGTAEIGSTEPVVPLDFYGNQVAIYHPWLHATTADDAVVVGPAGAVAGVVARTDRTRGVWKAPAGADGELIGVEALDQPVSAAHQEVYAAGFVNALRVISAEPVVWGARTRENPAGERQYVSVRRLATLIETSILDGSGFAAWEENDQDLWSRLSDRVEAFMDDLYRDGAFQGTTASQAYFVRVDASTTSAADIARGVAVVVVGFAPLRPSEFLVVQVEVPVGMCTP